MLILGKYIEVENRLVAVRGWWGEKNENELLRGGLRSSFRRDENVLKLVNADGCKIM